MFKEEIMLKIVKFTNKKEREKDQKDDWLLFLQGV